MTIESRRILPVAFFMKKKTVIDDINKIFIIFLDLFYRLTL